MRLDDIRARLEKADNPVTYMGTISWYRQDVRDCLAVIDAMRPVVDAAEAAQNCEPGELWNKLARLGEALDALKEVERGE